MRLERLVARLAALVRLYLVAERSHVQADLISTACGTVG